MIHRVVVAYTAELTKAVRARITYAGPILVAVTIVATAYAQNLGGAPIEGYAFIAYAVPLALNLLGLLMILLFTSALISGELNSGVIRLILVRPIRRWEYVAAKFLTALTYAVALALVASVAAWAFPLTRNTLTGVAIGREVIHTNFEMRNTYLLALAVSLLPLSAAIAYALLISAIVPNPGAAAGLTVGIWIVVDLVKNPLQITPYLFTSHLDRAWTVFAAKADGLNSGWQETFVPCAAVSLPAAVVFLSLTILIVQLRNLVP